MSLPPCTLVRALSWLTAGVDVLKVNKAEFAALCAELVPAEHAFPACAVAFATMFGLQALALTDGARPAFLLARVAPAAWQAWDVAIPPLSVVNAIGAGDTTAAVLFAGLLAGLPPLQAFKCVCRAC